MSILGVVFFFFLGVFVYFLLIRGKCCCDIRPYAALALCCLQQLTQPPLFLFPDSLEVVKVKARVFADDWRR